MMMACDNPLNGHAVSVNPPAAGHPTFSQSVGGPTQAADSPAPFYASKKLTPGIRKPLACRSPQLAV